MTCKAKSEVKDSKKDSEILNSKQAEELDPTLDQDPIEICTEGFTRVFFDPVQHHQSTLLRITSDTRASEVYRLYMI